MSYDRKYGQVTTERGSIGEDEPVVVFRAQDRLLPALLHAYWQLCDEAGTGMHHLHVISQRIADIQAWQESHPVKTPDTTPEQVPLNER